MFIYNIFWLKIIAIGSIIHHLLINLWKCPTFWLLWINCICNNIGSFVGSHYKRGIWKWWNSGTNFRRNGKISKSRMCWKLLNSRFSWIWGQLGNLWCTIIRFIIVVNRSSVEHIPWSINSDIGGAFRSYTWSCFISCNLERQWLKLLKHDKIGKIDWFYNKSRNLAIFLPCYYAWLVDI